MAQGFILTLYKIDGEFFLERRLASVPIRIGRNALNDCQITQNFVSDFHARIEDNEGRLAIRDLGSKNGIFVRTSKEMTPWRAPPQVALDLSAHNFEFFIGPFLRAELTFANLESSLDREPKSIGTVLGNKQMLRAGLSDPPRGGTGPTPLPDLRAMPPMNGPGGFQQPSGSFGGFPAPRAAQDSGAPSPYGSPYTPPGGPPQPQGPGGHGSGPPPGPADLKGTGHFDLSSEVLALQGLREMASSLVPGQTFQTKGDVARLITKIHDTIEVFCRCFIPLREGHAQFVSAMDLQRAAMQRSVNRSRGYMAVELATTPGDVAKALLDWRDPSLDGPKAIEGIFADLMLHQVALLDSLMHGVGALLEELSPENIERMVDAEEGRKPLRFVMGRHKVLWERFVARYEELSEEKQAFTHIFGPEFTEAYRDYARRRPGTP